MSNKPSEGTASAQTIEQVLAERGSRYGDFTDHARICQAIKMQMKNAQGSKWALLTDVQKQSLEVIADKIARILSGDPNYDDNWIDIQGYAKLAEERLPGKPTALQKSVAAAEKKFAAQLVKDTETAMFLPDPPEF